jgi:hypothetical protein
MIAMKGLVSRALMCVGQMGPNDFILVVYPPSIADH